MATSNAQHSVNSSYREKLIEHLFISEMLKLSWIKHDCMLEVSKPEVDNAGYDVLMEVGSVIRHIQLKASFRNSKTSKQNINFRLSEKPAGCVIWIIFDKNTLAFESFLWYGSDPNMPLTGLLEARVAKHTKGDSTGLKKERANIRVLSKRKFDKVDCIDGLFYRLFG
ncbi:hypothetical protein [Granulosicoccus antarcticus]|uniref:DUF4365 domain-containing protein n=1 Tax=Granulosicoccus antarcticus IMCC3135 TaxID=1192854 RepID=A0A2Z2NVI4_9GAMM|nr:hypothetical protein [Granulosicoccus antarcticus]ASJ75253.1 hypothetical protein IMCC3135_25990 [Granulosicoccus antarcticus IMCC3135]